MRRRSSEKREICEICGDKDEYPHYGCAQCDNVYCVCCRQSYTYSDSYPNTKMVHIYGTFCKNCFDHDIRENDAAHVIDLLSKLQYQLANYPVRYIGYIFVNESADNIYDAYVSHFKEKTVYYFYSYLSTDNQILFINDFIKLNDMYKHYATMFKTGFRFLSWICNNLTLSEFQNLTGLKLE